MAYIEKKVSLWRGSKVGFQLASSVTLNLRARSFRELSNARPIIDPLILGSARGDLFPISRRKKSTVEPGILLIVNGRLTMEIGINVQVLGKLGQAVDARFDSHTLKRLREDLVDILVLRLGLLFERRVRRVRSNHEINELFAKTVIDIVNRDAPLRRLE